MIKSDTRYLFLFCWLNIVFLWYHHCLALVNFLTLLCTVLPLYILCSILTLFMKPKFLVIVKRDKCCNLLLAIGVFFFFTMLIHFCVIVEYCTTQNHRAFVVFIEANGKPNIV